jgi:transcriptional regulator with XRE-family HTH domain
MVDDLPASLRKIMTERQLSQNDVASEAKVSQSSVSRALRSGGPRSGAAKRRLFKYIQDDPRAMPRQATEAIRNVWDGSPAHEVALAKLIEASGELWPRMREGSDRGADD